MGIPNVTLEDRVRFTKQMAEYVSMNKPSGDWESTIYIYNLGVRDCIDFIREIAPKNPHVRIELENLADQMEDLKATLEEEQQ